MKKGKLFCREVVLQRVLDEHCGDCTYFLPGRAPDEDAVCTFGDFGAGRACDAIVLVIEQMHKEDLFNAEHGYITTRVEAFRNGEIATDLERFEKDWRENDFEYAYVPYGTEGFATFKNTSATWQELFL